MTALNHEDAHRLVRRLPIRRVVALLLLATVLTCWFMWLRPTTLGGPLSMIRVTGQSMEPGMHTGDLALTRTDSSYDVGEVVAFQIPSPDGGEGPFVIHRVVAKQDGAMTMRGDNNDGNDPWTVKESDVGGELWLHIPKAGGVLATLSQPIVLGALAAATTAFLVLLGDRRPGERQPPARRFSPHRQMGYR